MTRSVPASRPGGRTLWWAYAALLLLAAVYCSTLHPSGRGGSGYSVLWDG